jgi:hypothetical protein
VIERGTLQPDGVAGLTSREFIGSGDAGVTTKANRRVIDSLLVGDNAAEDAPNSS